MEFKYQGRKIRLRGATPKKLKMIPGSSLNKMISTEGELFMLQVVPVLPEFNESEVEGKIVLQPEIAQILSKFQEVFAEPITLPPERAGFDHRIPLKEGTDAINLRPYRYPLSQKDAIEELTEELLEQGVIQNSNNPFASPVVLVKKKMAGGACV